MPNEAQLVDGDSRGDERSGQGAPAIAVVAASHRVSLGAAGSRFIAADVELDGAVSDLASDCSALGVQVEAEVEVEAEEEAIQEVDAPETTLEVEVAAPAGPGAGCSSRRCCSSCSRSAANESL